MLRLPPAAVTTAEEAGPARDTDRYRSACAGDARPVRREKPGQLQRPLATGEGHSTYQVGDLGYWAPSHDLAIFYHDDGQRIPSPGIVIIGRIDTGLDLIAEAGDSFQLTIEPPD